MFKRSILIACLVALALPAFAARKSAKAKKAESALSAELAKPVQAALDSLQALDDAAKGGRPKRASAAIKRADALKADLKEALNQVRDAKPEKDEAAAKDAAVVAVAAALRAADLVSQGLQEEDGKQVQAGLKLGEMAQGDLRQLEEEGAPAPGGGGGGGAATEYKIGPSIGANLALTGQTGGSNMSVDLSFSWPVAAAVDLGVGGSLSGSYSETGAGSYSETFGYGFNGFARYHFLELFNRAPWIVPYLGAKMGLNYSDNSGLSGGSFTETESTSTTLGGQLGVLFFVSAKSAITLQLEDDSNSSASGGKSSPSTNSWTLSLGARQMF